MDFEATLLSANSSGGGMYAKGSICDQCSSHPRLNVLRYKIYIGHSKDEPVFLQKEDHVCPNCGYTKSFTKNYGAIESIANTKS
jgi:hypothetical protein